MISLFPPMPGVSIDSNVGNLLISGTQENNDFQTILSSVADGLEQLQQNGVSVILRPWPEMNGGWFPWGTSGMSDSQFVAMWQDAHDYLTNTRGLHNIDWLWAPNACISGDVPAKRPLPWFRVCGSRWH